MAELNEERTKCLEFEEKLRVQEEKFEKRIKGQQAVQAELKVAREKIEAGVKALGFEVLGEPQLGIVAFTHESADVFAVYRDLYKKGWFASLTTQPPALHLMLSPVHNEKTDLYLDDLAASLKAAADAKPSEGFEARYS